MSLAITGGIRIMPAYRGFVGFRLFILLAITICAQNYAKTQECSERIATTYFPLQVESIQQKDLRLRGVRLFELGEGTSGTAYMALPTNGAGAFPVKAYHSTQVSTDFVISGPRDTDAFLLNFFRDAGMRTFTEVIVPRAHKVDFTYHYTSPQRVKHSWTIPGIRFSGSTIGRSVSSILDDKTIPKGLRDHVESEYRRRYRLVLKYLREHHSGRIDHQMHLDPLNPSVKYPHAYVRVELYRNRTDYISLDLTIKADGFIVDPHTLDFYIVDF